MGEVRVIVAGFGGQGILFLGRLIAYSGMIEGREVTFFPSYGAEMRGGTANCTAVISDRMIGSPVVRNPDILVVMNSASLKRFLPRLRPGGILVYDSSLVRDPELRPDITSFAVPASELAARDNGGPATTVKAANMVMLGALLSATSIVTPESALSALEKLTPAKRSGLTEENRAAIRKGIRYLEDTQGPNL